MVREWGISAFLSRFFCVFFQIFFASTWTFTLDNLDKGQEKSHEKIRKIF